MKPQLLIFCLLFTARALAQTSVSADLDADGKSDKVNLIAGEDGFKMTHALSGQRNKVVSTARIRAGGQQNTLAVKKNVLVLSCQFMRAIYTYKFRYDPALKQLRLIGYDSEQFGNAVHDGAGASSYNLLTGNYEAQWNYFDKKKNDLVAAPKISRKFSPKPCLFSAFGDAIVEELGGVDYSLVPRQLK
jgi:hypothetical protein